ncbi:MAG: peroxidase-related enzyme [Cyclobacteriaceae bacterium]|nr:peroxidase-related enzyme [Cyclobacteriaceae bacterium]
MAYIKLNNENLPGIVGLLDYRPETAKHRNGLAETLLRGKSTLTSGERELIAASVSNWNNCHFCFSSHGASAAAHLETSIDLLDEIKNGLGNTELSPKMKRLLNIAQKVQMGGKNVTREDIDRAREKGATDLEIHDTVLIAAAFCMFNRYVDGLGTWAPEEKEAYIEMGEKLAHQGYTAE